MVSISPTYLMIFVLWFLLILLLFCLRSVSVDQSLRLGMYDCAPCFVYHFAMNSDRKEKRFCYLVKSDQKCICPRYVIITRSTPHTQLTKCCTFNEIHSDRELILCFMSHLAIKAMRATIICLEMDL